MYLLQLGYYIEHEFCNFLQIFGRSCFGDEFTSFSDSDVEEHEDKSIRVDELIVTLCNFEN